MNTSGDGRQSGTNLGGVLGAHTAFRFVILLGMVSLLSDATYEGARSITGPLFAALGATGTAVGFVAGLGELAGYTLRLASGALSDRSRRYWTITFVGYAVNLLSVPLLALAGRWQTAAGLILAERVGKALRTPARDAMLSHATSRIGRGWGFGLHEALDQVGAIAGPLLVAWVLHRNAGFRVAFAVLLIPALLALATLTVARFLYPRPQELEIRSPHSERGGFPRVFWIYLAAAALVACGYADFPLIAYHLSKGAVVPVIWIPVLYATAMGVDALSALAFGRIFDRVGLFTLAVASLVSALFAPLVFLGGGLAAVAGMALWGIGMGAQESILRAAVAGMAPRSRRGTAYGVFGAAYGVSWFLGSALMGFLYDRSLSALVAFSVLAQIAAVPLFLWAGRKLPTERFAKMSPD